MRDYERSREQFKAQLDQEHQWPGVYLFKFIVPEAGQEQVMALFPPDKVTVKTSANGNYRSISAKLMMDSSEQVMKIYEQAYLIEGVLAL